MKRFLLIFTLCVTANVVFAQETQQYEPVKIKIIKPTDAWHARDFFKFNNKDLTINESEVLGIRAVYSKANDSPGWVLLNTVLYQNEKYFIYADSTIPFSSDTLFTEDWISNTIVSWDQKSWIISYLPDVLRSGDRNTFYKYEKDFIDYLDDINDYNEYFNGWWRFRIIHNSLYITQSGISLGVFEDMGFWILNNKKIDNGYQITVQGDTYFMEMEYKDSRKLSLDLPLPPYSKKRQFDLLLIRDNDYMDIYLENIDNKIATFVLVDEIVVDELNGLLFDNTCDLTKIKSFPRRADGSTDYPPPELSADTNITEETKNSENSDNTAIAESAIEKPAKTGIVFRVIMIAGIAVLLGGGVVVFVVRRRK